MCRYKKEQNRNLGTGKFMLMKIRNETESLNNS